MTNYKYKPGDKLGSLTILGYERIGNEIKAHTLRLRVLCECGREKLIIPNRLTELVKYNSCGYGCLFKDSNRHYPGKKVGQFTLIQKLEKSNWLCKCNCGKEFKRRSSNINKSESCGCLLRNEYLQNALKRVGTCYGKNKIKKLLGNRNGEFIYLVRCSCGFEREVRSKDITSLGESCGCIQKSGDDHPATLHSDSEIRSIRQLYKSGYYTIKQLSEMFKADEGYIYKIIKKHIRKSVI